jgi:hypothetical protein
MNRAEKPIVLSPEEWASRIALMQRLYVRLEGYATVTARVKFAVEIFDAYSAAVEMLESNGREIEDWRNEQLLAPLFDEVENLAKFIRDNEPMIVRELGDHLPQVLCAWIVRDALVARGVSDETAAAIAAKLAGGRIARLTPVEQMAKELHTKPHAGPPYGPRAFPFRSPATRDEFLALLDAACDDVERQGREATQMELASYWGHDFENEDDARMLGERRVRELLDRFGVDWVAFRRSRKRKP